MPKRALSPAGIRHLRQERAHLWPSDRVFTIGEFSSRVLQNYEQQTQKRIRPLKSLSKLELLSLEASGPTPASPLESLESIESFETLGLMNLSVPEWAELLQQMESSRNSQAELQIWTKRILSFLRASLESRKRNALLGDWELTQLACDTLQNLDQDAADLSWTRIAGLALESPDTLQPDGLQIVVPGWVELFPLEKTFLKRLSAHPTAPDFIFLNCEAKEFSEASLQTLHSLKPSEDSTAEKNLLLWGHVEKYPGPVESAWTLPGSGALNMWSQISEQNDSLSQSLDLWFDFHLSGTPSSHGFLWGTQHAERLQQAGFNLKAEPSLLTLCEFTKLKQPLLAEELRGWEMQVSSTKPEAAQIRQWVRVFNQLGLTHAKGGASAAPKYGRLANFGQELLELSDLPLCSGQRVTLISSIHDLRIRLNSESRNTLRTRPFPLRLTQLLEAMSRPVPDPARESQTLNGFLFSALASVQLSEDRHALPARAQPAPPVKTGPINRVLSPSSIESFYRCPFQFYAERVLKIAESESWDSLDLNPQKWGLWIHQALELFFQKPDCVHPELPLSEHLQSSLPETFSDHATKGYLQLLE